MGNVFLSFLGLGSFHQTTKQYNYSKTVFILNGVKSKETKFVQIAELEILGINSFDKIIIVATQKSYDIHFGNINRQLSELGTADIIPLIIEEDMSPEGQWKWFEMILDNIDYGDELTIDLTHGYRSIPIVFSTAVNFLQKAKNIALSAVYYGAYEKNKGLAPIVDMKDFYIINEWAEAVSRLIEDADARKMAAVAQQTDSFQAGELNDEKLIKAFDDLTNTVRNVDINHVEAKANAAIRLIKEKEEAASVTGKILLKLVMDKFVLIATDEPLSGQYDKPYFDLQLQIISLLLEHRLFMQAYTVMREFIGSIGMVEIEKAKISNKKGRNQRQRFAETFIKMLRYEEKRWRFEDKEKEVEILRPYYAKLKNHGIESILRNFTKELTDYRNSFAHAWTSKKEVKSDIGEKGYQFYNKLVEVVRLLEKNSMLN
ncbi:MAG: TIGR02221 family CRISPR-associated protein [Deltaproteobacteria bacterium]|nr:TIGR02221 family CRISPR-associated protein [Deltaproteobacteria bacterium]